MARLYDSPWPAEDGGPTRQAVPHGARLGLRSGERLHASARSCMMPTMTVLRGPGEVFLHGHSPPAPDSTSWVERIDPISLEPLARSPELAGGPFWPGGIVAHANGYLYVTYGRHCHKLDAGCRLLASRTLPRERPYNSLLVLSDGALVMKTLVRDGSERSLFTVIEPEGLTPTGADIEIPEPSIARISAERNADGEFVYVFGDHTIFRYRYADGRLDRDGDWSRRYRALPDAEQSYGWDPVIAGEDVWFLDNGDNLYQQSLAHTGIAAGPLHLVRINRADCRDWDLFAPFGIARGTVVNPPVVDAGRRIVVAFDSGNDRIAGFRYAGRAFARLWEHAFGASSHFLLFADTGEIVVNDFRNGEEHVVVLDVESGEERGRVAIGSPMQSVLFPSPGWNRDLYLCTFTTLARVWIESA